MVLPHYAKTVCSSIENLHNRIEAIEEFTGLLESFRLKAIDVLVPVAKDLDESH